MVINIAIPQSRFYSARAISPLSMSINTDIYGSPNEPTQVLFMSDVYGGADGNPLNSRNPDEMLSTYLRWGIDIPHLYMTDIFHQPRVCDHVLRAAVSLRDEAVARFPDLAKKHWTGIFINTAPRTGKGNGDPFYIAETNNGLRIVCTPLSALSPIKDRIVRLGHLPNEGNKLYGDTEQFRSSYTPILLRPNNGLQLEVDDVSIIPDEADDSWHVSYVDRFGNIITHAPDIDKQWQEVQQLSKKSDGYVGLTINGVNRKVSVGKSLSEIDPGTCSIYRTSHGGIDVVVKWKSDQTSVDRLKTSAFTQFAQKDRNVMLGDKLLMS